MLDFEAALARAEARAGVIPASAAAAIARPLPRRAFDVAGARPRRGARPAIPPSRSSSSSPRCVAQDDPAAARFVHWGATSQDAIDTGLVLQLRQALDPIEAELARLADGAGAARARAPRDAGGRPHLDAAGAAHDLRPEGRGMARRGRAPPRAGCRAAAAARSCCSSAARRERWPRWATKGNEVARGARRGAQARRCPTCPGTRTATAWPRWRRRSAWARARSGRSRATSRCTCRPRSAELVRARGGRARRLLDHAAQAQPRGLRGRAGGGDAHARPRGHDAGRHGPGGRARPGRLARRVGDAAGDRRARSAARSTT